MPGSKVTKPQLEEVERRIRDITDVFVSDVAYGRRVSFTTAETWATGQVWLATQAVKMGLADESAGAKVSSSSKASLAKESRVNGRVEDNEPKAADELMALAEDYLAQGRVKSIAEAIKLASKVRPDLAAAHVIEGRA